MIKDTVFPALTGTTAHYAGNGRKFGYPTANIASDTDLTDGVYFGYASLGQYTDHPAMIFIGTPVTVGDTLRRVEAHLMDIPDEDLYDLQLTLIPKVFHRPNQKFDSIDELMAAMKDDEAKAREWFK